MTRLLHLSDPHFGAADTAIAEAFLEAAAHIAPDFTILSGDLTMRARRRELEDAARFVSRLPTPNLIIPGNHDIPALNQPFDRFFRPFHRYRKTFGDELEPVHQSAGLHIAGLNSSRPFGPHSDWSVGLLYPWQIEKIRHTFAGDSTGFRILVLHHPLQSPGGHQRALVKPLAPLRQALIDARVDLVLCGHFHRSLISLENPDTPWKTILSQAATVCSTRLQGELQGFHEIHLNGDRCRLIRHTFGSGSFTPNASFHFIRDNTGWHLPDNPARP